MLSRTASPNWSGPPEASWPSSKTIWIDFTVMPLMFTGPPPDGGNASRTPPEPQRSRNQPLPAVCESGGGELQPMKYNVPSEVVTLNRGAPAPQCEPRGSAVDPGLRMS